jgi:tRNA A-37 threonylcarbamoyl transferase component Bud32
MNEFPFQLVIHQVFPKKRTEILSCVNLLRAIPGRRTVYDALWNQKSVIVKVFSHKLSSKLHLRREWKGLNNLAHRTLNAPEPLFYGQTEDGQWAVVVEKITESVTALEVFERLHDSAEQLDLLISIARELARQHTRGVLQKDLHLGNYLLREDKVYILDVGQIRFFPNEIGRKKSITQLAILAARLPDRRKEALIKLCKEYFAVRNWQFEKSDEIFFHKELAAFHKRAISRGLKKSLRTNKRHIRIQHKQFVAVFDRNFCSEAGITDFIEHIDAFMDAGEIFKNGNTCYVSRLSWNGREIVVKRFNHKGFVHSMRQAIRRSRARRCWLYGHRLGMLNVSTPKPLAYIEYRKGWLVWKSYLITEYVKGQKLYHFLRDQNISETQRSSVLQQMNHLLDKMGVGRMTHGDLKHTNIIITKDGPVLTDLDSMQVHRWSWSYRIRRAKDLERIKWE